MNKNILKSIVLSTALLVGGLFFLPHVTHAASRNPDRYVEIPLQFSRPKPTMTTANDGQGCSATVTGQGECVTFTSGIGVYNYVGSGVPNEKSIKSLTVTDKTITDSSGPDDTSGIQTNYKNFSVVDGKLRVYGLIQNHQYVFSFAYDDASSPDIATLVGQVKTLCGNNQSGPSKGQEKAWDIVTKLANGCSIYNSSPFLPTVATVVAPASGATGKYNGGHMVLDAVNITAPQPTSSEQGSSDDGDTCPLKDGAPLRWIGCPLIELGGSTADALQEQIRNFLYTPTEQIFGNEGFRTIANTFRNLGIALIVIAGLVMVISQASGLDFIDAYTVRKLLPRMIVALIGVVLAMPLLEIIVTIFNDLGIWMNDLIMSAVNIPTDAGKFGTGTGTNILQYSFASVAFLGALAFLGFGGIVSLIGTVILALFIGFIVLAVRQMVVLVCVLLAPLAIAAYVLPGTQKLWDFWKGAFITAMTIFPIIMLFIASGKALSTVLGGAGSSELSLLAIIVYFAPYFLLPFAFKLAGGLMSTIFSIANDPARGGFDRLKKYRQGKTAANIGAMKEGNRFNNRALNTMTARATTSRLGFGKRGRSAYEQKMALASHNFSRSEQGQAIQFNDPALQAMTYGSAMEARARMGRDFGITDSKEIESAIAAVKANGGFGKTRQVWAAKQLAATGTGYQDSEQMFSTIARASGGNLDLAQSMWGEMRGTSERAGRNDMKASYSMGAKFLSKVMGDGQIHAGTEAIRSRYQNDFMEMGIDAARGVDNMSAMRNKPRSIQNMMRDLDRGRTHYEQTMASPNATAAERQDAEVKLGQIRAKMENLRDHAVYGPEVNAEAINGMRTAERQNDGQRVRDVGVGNALGPAQEAQQRSVGSQAAYNEERMQRVPSREDVEMRGGGPGAGPDPGGDE